MKFFIPSLGRAKTITSHELVPEAWILLHTNKEKQRYIKAGVDPKRIWVTNQPIHPGSGKSRQIQWALQNLTSPNEWAFFCDDNVKHFEKVAEPWYQSEDLHSNDGSLKPKVWHERYRVPIEFEDLIPALEEDQDKAESIGANYWGMSTTPNFFFRSKKHSTIVLISGKAFMMRNTPGLPFNHNAAIAAEDTWLTLEHLYQYGTVLRNNYLYVEAEYWQDKGGFGSTQRRVKSRTRDLKNLLRLFPGLATETPPKTMATPPLSLKLKIRTHKSLECWRQKARKLRGEEWSDDVRYLELF